MSKKDRIRPLALCVFRRGDKIFVAEGHDNKRDLTFYRPIGGGIEFGERAIDTIKREVQEEINAEVSNLVYLDTLENIFVYDGSPGHEICLIFDGTFVDDFRNADDYTVVGSDDDATLYNGSWKSLGFFRERHAPLYPDGLLELLDKTHG